MATKTITLELDAYEKLRRAKRSPRESFTSVVRRARWTDAPSARALLGSLRELVDRHPESLLDEVELAAVEQRITARDRRPRDRGTAG